MGSQKFRRPARRARQNAYLIAIWLAVIACAGAGILVWRPFMLTQAPDIDSAKEPSRASTRYLGTIVEKDPDGACTKFVFDNASGRMTARARGRCEEMAAGMQSSAVPEAVEVRRLRSISKVFRHAE